LLCFWWAIPQSLNTALIPLIILIVFRSGTNFRKAST
jgi:hypothetical protein